MSRSELQKIHDDFDSDMSWAIFALKVLIGDNDFRNYYVKKNCDDISHLFTMAGEDYTKNKLINQLKSVDKNTDNIITFTIAQRATVGNPTHYIGFVVMKEEQKLYILDPAMGTNGFSYSADEETGIVREYFDKYEHIFIQPSYTACQTSSEDTYCQSWSLWLIVKFLKHYLDSGVKRCRKKKGDKICSINFFGYKGKVKKNKMITTLKKELFIPVLNIIDSSEDILTTGVTGNHLDLELQYIHLRYNYDEFVECLPSVYKAFYKTKFGKSLSEFGIKKKKDKLPKSRGKIHNEAYLLLRVMNENDLLA